MPYSYPLFKEQVKEHFLKYIPRDTKILDVGVGCGTYSDLLKSHFPYMDGVEIFEPYIQQFNLAAKYNILHLADIRTLDISEYQYIIMGDVLEHLSYPDAKALVDKITSSNIKLLVAIPYEYEQGAWGGNDAEIHHQPDLTHDLFLVRYPQMRYFVGDNKYGYFLNY